MPSDSSVIKVRLPDDSVRELPAGSTGLDLAQSIGKRLAQAAVATVVNGVETDLGVALADGAQVSIVTSDSDAGRHVLRHSTAHVLAQAVVQLFEGAKFTIGPAIEDASITTLSCRTIKLLAMPTWWQSQSACNKLSLLINRLCVLKCRQMMR